MNESIPNTRQHQAGTAAIYGDHITGAYAPLGNDARIQPLVAQRAVLIAYLRSKLDADDMHAVQDAASDIRELDAKLSMLK